MAFNLNTIMTAPKNAVESICKMKFAGQYYNGTAKLTNWFFACDACKIYTVILCRGDGGDTPVLFTVKKQGSLFETRV